MQEDGAVCDAETGELRGFARGSEYDAARFIKVVLTVAHVDHDPTNNDESNLSAWCQLHHLRHDATQHAATRKRTRYANQRKLF
jgi:hypothetical protein